MKNNLQMDHTEINRAYHCPSQQLTKKLQMDEHHCKIKLQYKFTILLENIQIM